MSGENKRRRQNSNKKQNKVEEQLQQPVMKSQNKMLANMRKMQWEKWIDMTTQRHCELGLLLSAQI